MTEPVLSASRFEQDLSRGWTYVPRRMGRRWARGLASDPPDALTVDVPHCWNTQDTFAEGVAYRRGAGSYRIRFHLDSPDPELRPDVWRIETDGFYGTGDLWLNGEMLGAVDGNYLGIRCDVSKRLRTAGVNDLAFRLTNRCTTDVLPGIRDPDFLLYGGLSGGVRLVGLPLVHLERETVFVQCLRAEPREARLRIDYAVCRGVERSDDDAARVEWRILDAAGKCVTSCAGTAGDAECEVSVPSPLLWSPDRPTLYTAEGTLQVGGEIRDRLKVRFGIRDARFKPDRGFFLNGRRLELRGVNRHEDMPGFGRALPPEIHLLDARTLREAGLNFVRLSHYPQDPAFLDACDEMGILVYAEIATWKSVRRGRWLDNACRQMRGMIERDRNHPSVILWGMGNEAQDRIAYERLGALAHELDPTRSVIYAENHIYRARRRDTIGLSDVWGVNYELDQLEDAREAAKLRVVVVSECSNLPDTERGRAPLEREQAETIQNDLARLDDRPFVAGFALWCFADYATLRKRRYRRFSGFVDAWRLPKAAFHFLRARYSPDPVLHVAGAWGEGYPADDGPGELLLCTNCDEVRIRIGDREQVVSGDTPLTVFRPDVLGADLRAEGIRNGEIVPFDLPWHGVAERMTAEAEPGFEPDARPPGVLCVFRVQALDARGFPARSATGLVSVHAEGPIQLCPWRSDECWVLSGGLTRVFARRLPGNEPVRLLVRPAHRATSLS